MDENMRPEGEARVVRPSMWTKVKRALLPEGETSFGKFFFQRVFVPWLKDGFWASVDRIRYRDTGYVPPRTYSNPNGYVEYGKKSKNPSRPLSRDYFWDYDTITFSDSGKAAWVLDQMRGDIHTYGRVTIAAMYDYAGVSTNGTYTYRNYGWTNLDAAGVRRMGIDYVLDLPSAVALD